MANITSASAPIVAVFESAQSIRIIMIDNEPWFSVADVCDILGYSNSRKTVADHCRAGGVTKRDTPTASGTQAISYINEGNLYRLVIKSRMPAAEKFEAWVCDEVLPSIRKTGSYSVTDSCQDLDGMQPIDEEQLLAMKARVSRIARMFLTMTPQKVSTLIYGRIKSTFRVSRIDDMPAYAVGYADAIISRVEALASANYSRLKRDESKMLFDLNLPEGGC